MSCISSISWHILHHPNSHDTLSILTQADTPQEIMAGSSYTELLENVDVHVSMQISVLSRCHFRIPEDRQVKLLMTQNVEIPPHDRKW